MYTLALCLATTCALAAAEDAPFILGVNGHPHQQEGCRAVPLDQQMDLLCELGVHWYRTDWGPGYDFTQHDALVAAAEAKGIRLLPILFPDVSAAKGDIREIRRLAFDYGKAVASRYRGCITHYELSNERHWYSEMGDITTPKQSYSGTWDVLEKLKSWGKEVWLTEGNRRHGDMNGQGEAQAAYLTDQITKLRASGIVKAYFVYELLDEPYFEGGEAHYGLVQLDRRDGKWTVGQRKPAFQAIQRLATQP